jgi:hypothetical protein
MLAVICDHLSNGCGFSNRTTSLSNSKWQPGDCIRPTRSRTPWVLAPETSPGYLSVFGAEGVGFFDLKLPYAGGHDWAVTDSDRLNRAQVVAVDFAPFCPRRYPLLIQHGKTFRGPLRANVAFMLLPDGVDDVSRTVGEGDHLRTGRAGADMIAGEHRHFEPVG